MFFYTVPRIGSGTDADPYRPDLPAGVDYCAAYGQVGSSQTALVRTLVSLPNAPGRTSRSPTQVEASARSIGIPDRDPVDHWRIGGA
jgi:hypothetical protein